MMWEELVKSKKPIKLKTPTKPKTTHQRPVRRTKPDSSTPFVSATLHERIATRAFEHYERRLRQGTLDDWLQAEQEIEPRNIRHAYMPDRGGSAGEGEG